MYGRNCSSECDWSPHLAHGLYSEALKIIYVDVTVNAALISSASSLSETQAVWSNRPIDWWKPCLRPIEETQTVWGNRPVDWWKLCLCRVISCTSSSVRCSIIEDDRAALFTVNDDTFSSQHSTMVNTHTHRPDPHAHYTHTARGHQHVTLWHMEHVRNGQYRSQTQYRPQTECIKPGRIDRIDRKSHIFTT